ncbi:hypothetical protein EI555_020483 [Monodon monoceros]|uniref:Uncharacterized protein n=1 Tax=Monodon monoceros TaxID=40151 RepID=A0A4U1F2P9_MONMO|nr:hypothetical protein EI555_020483 [Monodon monoceros]
MLRGRRCSMSEKQVATPRHPGPQRHRLFRSWQIRMRNADFEAHPGKGRTVIIHFEVTTIAIISGGGIEKGVCGCGFHSHAKHGLRRLADALVSWPALATSMLMGNGTDPKAYLTGNTLSEFSFCIYIRRRDVSKSVFQEESFDVDLSPKRITEENPNPECVGGANDKAGMETDPLFRILITLAICPHGPKMMIMVIAAGFRDLEDWDGGQKALGANVLWTCPERQGAGLQQLHSKHLYWHKAQEAGRRAEDPRMQGRRPGVQARLGSSQSKERTTKVAVESTTLPTALQKGLLGTDRDSEDGRDRPECHAEPKRENSYKFSMAERQGPWLGVGSLLGCEPRAVKDVLPRQTTAKGMASEENGLEGSKMESSEQEEAGDGRAEEMETVARVKGGGIELQKEKLQNNGPHLELSEPKHLYLCVHSLNPCTLVLRHMQVSPRGPGEPHACATSQMRNSEITKPLPTDVGIHGALDDLVVILGYTAQAVVPGLFDLLKMAGEEVLATTGHGLQLNPEPRVLKNHIYDQERLAGKCKEGAQAGDEGSKAESRRSGGGHLMKRMLGMEESDDADCGISLFGVCWESHLEHVCELHMHEEKALTAGLHLLLTLQRVNKWRAFSLQDLPPGRGPSCRIYLSGGAPGPESMRFKVVFTQHGLDQDPAFTLTWHTPDDDQWEFSARYSQLPKRRGSSSVCIKDVQLFKNKVVEKVKMRAAYVIPKIPKTLQLKGRVPRRRPVRDQATLEEADFQMLDPEGTDLIHANRLRESEETPITAEKSCGRLEPQIQRCGRQEEESGLQDHATDTDGAFLACPALGKEPPGSFSRQIHVQLLSRMQGQRGHSSEAKWEIALPFASSLGPPVSPSRYYFNGILIKAHLPQSFDLDVRKTVERFIVRSFASQGQEMETEWLSFRILVPERKLNKENPLSFGPYHSYKGSGGLECWASAEVAESPALLLLPAASLLSINANTPNRPYHQASNPPDPMLRGTKSRSLRLHILGEGTNRGREIGSLLFLGFNEATDSWCTAVLPRDKSGESRGSHGICGRTQHPTLEIGMAQFCGFIKALINGTIMLTPESGLPSIGIPGRGLRGGSLAAAVSSPWFEMEEASTTLPAWSKERAVSATPGVDLLLVAELDSGILACPDSAPRAHSQDGANISGREAKLETEENVAFQVHQHGCRIFPEPLLPHRSLRKGLCGATENTSHFFLTRQLTRAAVLCAKRASGQTCGHEKEISQSTTKLREKKALKSCKNSDQRTEDTLAAQPPRLRGGTRPMTVTSPSARESENDSPMGGQTEAQGVRALPKLSHLPYWDLGWQTHQGELHRTAQKRAAYPEFRRERSTGLDIGFLEAAGGDGTLEGGSGVT